MPDMALTLPALVARAIDRLNLGVPALTDTDARPPLPYIFVNEPLGSPADPTAAPQARHGGRKGVLTELQIDVLQHKLVKAAGTDRRDLVYDPLLPELVAAGLDGAQLQTTADDFPARVYGCRLVDGPHAIPTPRAQNEVHHVIDIRIHRDLVTARP